MSAVIAVGGCGGSSGSKGLTKAEWIQKADALCAKTFPQQRRDEARNDLKDVVSLAKETLSQIRALPLPTEGATQVKSILNQEQHAIVGLSAGVSEQSIDASAATGELQKAAQMLVAAQKAAGSFGMNVCNAGQ